MILTTKLHKTEVLLVTTVEGSIALLVYEYLLALGIFLVLYWMQHLTMSV